MDGFGDIVEYGPFAVAFGQINGVDHFYAGSFPYI